MAKAPIFATEQEESDFWDTHDSTEYMDGTVPVEMDFGERPRKTLISLRMDPPAIEKVRAVAAKKGVGYLTLMRMWVMERLEEETAKELAGTTSVGD